MPVPCKCAQWPHVGSTRTACDAGDADVMRMKALAPSLLSPVNFLITSERVSQWAVTPVPPPGL